MLAENLWSDTETSASSSAAVSNENTLLSQYSFLVKRAAGHLRSLLGSVVDSDDLQQIGLLGLLSAVRLSLIHI